MEVCHYDSFVGGFATRKQMHISLILLDCQIDEILYSLVNPLVICTYTEYMHPCMYK